jgi:hypothetical protein
MTGWLLLAGAAYLGLALAGYLRTHLLQAFWRSAVQEMFPEIMKNLWDVYPGRRWPGPLKIVGIPMAAIFVLTMGILLLLAYLTTFLVLSPRAVWCLLKNRKPKGPGPPGPLDPVVEAKMRAVR